MTCTDCTQAKTQPWPIYNQSCTGCKARALDISNDTRREDMNRRGLLGAILAAATAPAFASAGSLMPIWTPQHTLWADGVHDDADAFDVWVHGGRVLDSSGRPFGSEICWATIALGRKVVVRNCGQNVVIVCSQIRSLHGFHGDPMLEFENLSEKT